MKLIVFEAYRTLISTGTGSLDAVKKILALQDKDINLQEFYKEWKKQHRINMDNANANLFINEEAVFVGDSYVDDICGPGKVGMKTILIDRKHTFRCEKNEFRTWKITNSLENIMELVSE